MARRSSLLATLAAAAILSLASLAHAADRTWTGAGATEMMSESANWEGGILPQRGDRLFFPQVAQMRVRNDLLDASFDSLHFSGTADTAVYLLAGNPMTLTGAPTVVVSGPVVAFVVVSITFPASYVRFETTGAPIPNRRLPGLQFANSQLQFSGGLLELVAPVGDIEMRSTISETAPTSIQSQGIDIYFDGQSSFTGTVEAFGGFLGVGSENALGSPAGATYVKGNTTLSITNPLFGPPELVIPEPFVLENTPDVSAWGSIEAISSGPIRLTGDVALLTPQVIQSNKELTFDGVVSGPGHVEIGLADGMVAFTNGQNTFNGGITVSRGTLRAGNSWALGFQNSLDVEGLAIVDFGFTAQDLTRFTCRGGKVKGVIGAAELSVRDPVTLTGCALEPATWPGFIPQSGQVLTMIRNGSGVPIAGYFDFFWEGREIDVNGVKTTVSYHAGSGNDFAFVAEVLPVAQLQAWGGTLMSLQHGERSGAPLSANAFDRFGRPAPNARVTFTAPPGCGTFSNGSPIATVTTNSNGFAVSPAFSGGNQSGICFVQAQGDAGGSASFEMHIYDPSEVVITPLPAASQSTIANQQFSIGAEVRGRGGMSLPYLQVVFSQELRGNGVGAAGAYGLPRYDLFTDPATSRVALTLTANNKSGSYGIVVGAGGVSITIPVSQKTH